MGVDIPSRTWKPMLDQSIEVTAGGGNAAIVVFVYMCVRVFVGKVEE